MKKLILSAIGLMTLLSACKKNDNNNPTIDKTLLYGKWVETFEVLKEQGSAPDTQWQPSNPFLYNYTTDYLVFMVAPPYDSIRYTVNGTTLNWLDSNGNISFKQNINVLNDSMLVLSQHYTTTDIIAVAKRL
ncbi:hypothetical protein [Taibaiella soli]|uniref:Lipocalin-like domain-containing protein n=1 Tax=Taibaiella soli TaxID=1649169 RepID=A0A2W2AQB0_9BACT|nr:hypothetical protein [Taibaiella soli]PZF74600.1 hypothetical protein DN068_03210 [Taibaiella soli]